MSNKNGIIYKITNKINNKVYIGKTSRSFKRRVKEKNYKSCTALNNAIKSHGWDNFEKEEFICALDNSYLASLEEMTIKYFDCLAPKGYNLIKVDNGLNVYPEEVCKKISVSRRKYLANLESPVIAVNRKSHIIIDNIDHKECTKCSGVFTLEEFNNDKNRWDGKDSYCKPCSR